MDGPWTKYQKAAPAPEAGPWTKYAGEALKDAPADTPAAPESDFFSKDPGAVRRAALGAGYNLPLPGLEAVKTLARKGGKLLENAGDATAEVLGKVGLPDAMAATAGLVTALPGKIYQEGADYVPSTPGQIMEQEAVGRGAAKALEVAAPLAVGAAKKLGTGITGVAGKDLAARFARNAEVKAAKPIAVLAEDLPATVNELRDTVSDLSSAALDKLSRETSLQKGGIRTESLMRAVAEEKAALGDGVSNATAKANETLDKYMKRLSELPPTLSEYDVGKFIRDFDHDINWEKPELAPQNHALQGLRASVDNKLKTLNPAYGAAMVPTAEATSVLEKVRQLFNLKKDVGSGYVAGDSTATKIRSAIGDNRLESQRVLEGLKKYTGRDLLQEVEDALTAEKFVGGKSHGSTRANIGMVAGGLSGLVSPAMAGPAAVAGGLTGRYLDTHGHEVARGAIDQLARLASQPRPSLPSGALQNAIGAAILANSRRRKQ